MVRQQRTNHGITSTICSRTAYNTLERKFQLFQFRPLELLRICSIIKLEDSGIDQLSVAMKQWTGSVSADCGARPWVEREPQAE